MTRDHWQQLDYALHFEQLANQLDAQVMSNQQGLIHLPILLELFDQK